jgi:drug/metabolite transporter (DMT)-like permease
VTPIILALGCAVCWLLANVTIRPVATRHGPFRALVFAQTFGLGIALVATLGLEGPPAPPTTSAGWTAFAIAAPAALLAYAGLFSALATGRLSIVAPIIASWSAPACIAGLLFFGEELSSREALGIGAIFFGTLVLARIEGRGQKNAAGKQGGGILAAMASALGFAAMVTAVKVLGDDTGPMAAVVWTWTGELVLAFGFLIWRGQLRPWPQSRRAWAALALPGSFEVTGFVCMSAAVAIGPVAIVAPVSNLATALSVLWGLVVLRERLPRPALIAGLVVSVGVVLTSAG